MRIRTTAWRKLSLTQKRKARDLMKYYRMIKLCTNCHEVYGLDYLDKNDLCPSCNYIKNEDKPKELQFHIPDKVIAYNPSNSSTEDIKNKDET